MRSQLILEKEQVANSVISMPAITEVKGLRKLFLDELRDIYWAEKSLTSLFPKIVDNVSSEELADRVLDQLGMTLNHITRLEVAFSSLGEKPLAVQCDTMMSLIKETEHTISLEYPGMFRDLSFLALLKKIGQYEIASYGILCSFASAMGEIEALALFEETLHEEREIYRSVAEMSKEAINR